MIVNIFGASGSGKTTLIRNAIQGNMVASWLRDVTNNTNMLLENPRMALSVMPIPKFRGCVESYLNLFGIKYEEIMVAPAELKMLHNTIFPVINQEYTAKNSLRAVETLSAGEGRRLSLLRCIMEKADVYVIDEPFTNSHSDLNNIIIGAINLSQVAILLTHEPVRQSNTNTSELIVLRVEDARVFLQGVEAR